MKEKIDVFFRKAEVKRHENQKKYSAKSRTGNNI